jgi:succinoglycan biosynthesis transport protein ExoP
MAQSDEVKLHFLDYWRVVRIRWPLVLLAFLLVLLTAAVVTYFQPREYQSSVFMEVKSTAENPRIFGGDFNQPVHDPQLAPTVYQVIQRTGILYPVIDELKLQDKWAREGRRPSREVAYQILRSKLDVDEVRNTDLLQISVTTRILRKPRTSRTKSSLFIRISGWTKKKKSSIAPSLR